MKEIKTLVTAGEWMKAQNWRHDSKKSFYRKISAKTFLFEHRITNHAIALSAPSKIYWNIKTREK